MKKNACIPTYVHTCRLYLNNLEEANWALGGENGLVRLGGRARNTVVELELEILLDVLLGDIALELAGRNDASVNDLNGRATSTVATSELSIHLINGTVNGHITVLLVHVVSARARVVADGDTVVLDVARVLLEDLSDTDDLTEGRLGLVELAEEVPEARLCNGLVLSEQLHAEDLGVGVLLGGLVAADDFVEVVDRHLNLDTRGDVRW